MDNKQEKAVLFDLFGTLCGATSPEWRIIDELKLSKDAHKGLQKIVCGTKFDGDEEKYYGFIMKEAGILNTEENRNKVRKIYRLELEKAIIFPEAEDVLNILQQQKFKLGIVSNAYPPTRQKIIEKNDLEQYFDTILLSYEEGITKQIPEIYNIALQRMGIDAKNAIMIGDSLNSDILVSKKATNGKIGGILVSQKKMVGNKDYDFLVVSSLKEVPDAVEEFFC